ncbi:MAG: hypothetical protein WEC75_02150 [Dehalococcoidia bacterium]
MELSSARTLAAGNLAPRTARTLARVPALVLTEGVLRPREVAR